MSSIDSGVIAWRAEGKHLPRFMRDFDDQKNLFKTMHELTYSLKDDIAGDIDFIEGQVYTIDKFLWFMARHGYTIQKTRTKLDFEDIEETVANTTKQRDSHLTNLLLNAMSKNKQE